MNIQMIIQMSTTLLINKSKQKLLKVNIIIKKYEKDNNFLIVILLFLPRAYAKQGHMKLLAINGI